jgi:hypothetical protein
MTFKWHDAQVSCERDCAGWIGAVGVITSDTPAKFEEFAKDRKLKGAMVVLDSSGGSVLDAIALGRRWRGLGLRTTVGLVISSDERRDVLPDAYCESMCIPAAVGQHADRAGRRARPRTPDMDGRSR